MSESKHFKKHGRNSSAVPDYWLDSDALMTPKDAPYRFEMIPQFWEFIERKADEGIIASSVLVYKEICEAYDDDPLRTWAEARPGPPLFLEPDEAVQRCMNEVANYVNANYEAPWAGKFLSGADPWLIAHAKAKGGRVVGFEREHGLGGKEPKIPNVCLALGLPNRINTYAMLAELSFRVS